MIRKSITYLFLLLANFILVSHSLIPHHHHDKQICFDSSHCAKDCLTHHDHAPLHQHDDDHEGHTCFLSEFIPIALNTQGIIHLTHEKSLLSGESTFLHAANYLINQPQVLKVCKRYSGDISLNYLSDIQDNTGLRAPPAV